MISIQSVVKEILMNEEEPVVALTKGYLNLSSYAKQIKSKVEHKAKKSVQIGSIIIALSRIKKSIIKVDPLVYPVAIDSITTKIPLAEIVYNKSPLLLKELRMLYDHVSTDSGGFLTMTLSTREITIICSDTLVQKTLKQFKEKPKRVERNLAGVSIAFNESYYSKPNVIFSLIRKLAVKKIVIAEVISTYTEIIFVFNRSDLNVVLELFSEDCTDTTK